MDLQKVDCHDFFAMIYYLTNSICILAIYSALGYGINTFERTLPSGTLIRDFQRIRPSGIEVLHVLISSGDSNYWFGIKSEGYFASLIRH